VAVGLLLSGCRLGRGETSSFTGEPAPSGGQARAGEAASPAEGGLSPGEARQDRGAALPIDAQALVGAWVAGATNDMSFPPDFELFADGTMSAAGMDEELDEDETASLTWQAPHGRLILTVTVRSTDGEPRSTATVAYDYTLTDSTLTLSNGLLVYVENGQTKNDTAQGQATYTRRDVP